MIAFLNCLINGGSLENYVHCGHSAISRLLEQWRVYNCCCIVQIHYLLER